MAADQIRLEPLTLQTSYTIRARQALHINLIAPSKTDRQHRYLQEYLTVRHRFVRSDVVSVHTRLLYDRSNVGDDSFKVCFPVA